MLWLRLLPALFLASSVVQAADCQSLAVGSPEVAVLISPGSAGCFALEVRDQPVRISVDQPVDLEIRVAGAKSQPVVDSFEFGTETATIEEPGVHRIDVLPVGRPLATSLSVRAAAQTLSPADGATWREIEALSTRSKRSGKPEDIAASLAAWQIVGDRSAIARTLLKSGDANLASRDFRQAEESYEQALRICQSLREPRCWAEAANNSGLVARRLGDFDASLSRLTIAGEGWKNLGNRDAEGLTFSNLGLLFRQTGDYQQAIAYYQQAATALRSAGKLARARVTNNLGVCYQSLAEYDRARFYFESALRDFLATHSDADAIRARLNLGRTQMLAGQRAAAERTLDQALAEATASDDRSVRGDVLNNLSQLLLRTKNRASGARAQSLLREALDLHSAIGDARMEAFDLHYLGVADLQLGELESARGSLIRALEIQRSGAMREAHTESLYALAEVEIEAGRPDEARRFAQEALTALEAVRFRVPGPALRASFYSRQRALFELLLRIAMEPGGPAAAEEGLLTVERGRGRALLDMLAEGNILAQSPTPLIRQRAAIQSRIDLLSVQLTGASIQRAAELRRQVELLVGEDEQLESEIRQSLPEQATGQNLTAIAEFQRTTLPANSAVLDYFLGDAKSYLWLVTKDDVRVFPLPPKAIVEAQSAAVLSLFSEVLERQRLPAKQRRFESALRLLSDTLTGPIRDLQLPPRLIVVPDGVLTRIPFAALESGHGARLGLKYDLCQISSLAFLAAGRQPRRPSEFPKSILALADPVLSVEDPRVPSGLRRAMKPAESAAFGRLPFNEDLEAISALVPTSKRRVLIGFDASRANLERSGPERYAFIHFSTHALIDDRVPELSRIALSMFSRNGHRLDGVLRPTQLSEFRLDGSTVVLSACDTALGKEVLGEGLVGLTASLFQAGASQLVLTLSEVDGEASAAFFGEVYRQVFGSRNSSTEHALTEARRAFSRSQRWSDPYYWASFVLYGRPV